MLTVDVTSGSSFPVCSVTCFVWCHPVCSGLSVSPQRSPFLCLDLVYISVLLQELGFSTDKQFKVRIAPGPEPYFLLHQNHSVLCLCFSWREPWTTWVSAGLWEQLSITSTPLTHTDAFILEGLDSILNVLEIQGIMRDPEPRPETSVEPDIHSALIGTLQVTSSCNHRDLNAFREQWEDEWGHILNISLGPSHLLDLPILEVLTFVSFSKLLTSAVSL